MPPSTIAGRYVVERAVGHGGMGTVWLCRDEVLGRSVAVKEVGSMPGTSTSDLARALREARNSAALNHRNVVSIFDAVEDGDHNWLVMEYVPSRNLSEMVAQEGPLSPERVVWIGAQAADGLAAAHQRGTMHRDVKPGNILVTDEDQVKIADFGIARTHGDAQLTRSGIVTGTPAFFAPELAKGQEPTVAADVWALGASLYSAVEGRLPYPDQANAIALLTQIANGPPRSTERAEFLTEPIARMMDPDPSTRWTMSDVAHTLHRLHGQHGIKGSGPSTVSLTAALVEAAARSSAEAEPESQFESDGGPVTEAISAPTTETETGEGLATEAIAAPTPQTETQTQTETEATEAPTPLPPVGTSGSDLPPRSDERNGGRRFALAAVVLLVALAAVGALLLQNRDGGDTPVADKPKSSATTGSDDSGSGEEAESADPDSPTPAPSDNTGATAADQFIGDYYALLPSDTETAWSLISPARQSQIGGYNTYAGFWGTISKVQVNGTTAVSEGVVDVKLTYTSDGGTESETRRVRLEKNGDTFLIAGDQVV